LDNLKLSVGFSPLKHQRPGRAEAGAEEELGRGRDGEFESEAIKAETNVSRLGDVTGEGGRAGKGIERKSSGGVERVGSGRLAGDRRPRGAVKIELKRAKRKL